MSQLKVDEIVDSSGGSAASINGLTPTESNMSGRNRIINGCMRIDQRNAGASANLTSSNAYYLDRWISRTGTGSSNTVQQSSTAPVGFTNSLLVTIGTGASPAASEQSYVMQVVEGFNFADLSFGLANARTVTISFWVRSSVTGTFSGALENSGNTRSYPFTYTISAANTFEYKTVTIDGDTTGTWLTNNGVGCRLIFDLGTGSDRQGSAGAWAAGFFRAATGSTKLVETSGATFYITGVQLEVGSVATPFERRPYGTELSLCQRYFEKSYNIGDAIAAVTDDGVIEFGGSTNSFNDLVGSVKFAVYKRADPTMTFYNRTSGANTWEYARNGASGTASVTTSARTGQGSFVCFLNAGASWVVANMAGHWTASSEL
jgi:hypothetical protein